MMQTGALPTGLSFCDLTVEYEQNARRLGRRTKINRLSHFRQLGAGIGDVLAQDIDAGVVDRYVNKRIDAGLKAVSINNELRALRVLLRWAVRGGLIRDAIVIELLHEEDIRPRFWTEDQVERLLVAIAREAPAILPLIMCIANTGCRCGEALAVSWPHVNLERGFLEIWPSREWKPKGGKAREVPLSKPLRALFERLPRSSRWAFPCSTGDRWAVWPQRLFDRARAAAGLEGGPYTLRHSYASIFLSLCPDLPLLAKIMGHTDEKVTRLYAHLLPEHLERARDVVVFYEPGDPAARTKELLRRARSVGAWMFHLVERLIH